MTTSLSGLNASTRRVRSSPRCSTTQSSWKKAKSSLTSSTESELSTMLSRMMTLFSLLTLELSFQKSTMLAQRMSTTSSGWQTSLRKSLRILSPIRSGSRLSVEDTATPRNSRNSKKLLLQLLLMQTKLSRPSSKTFTKLRLRMMKRTFHSTLASEETLTELMSLQLPLTLKSQRHPSLAVRMPELLTSLSSMPLLVSMIASLTSLGSLTSLKNAATTLTATTMESRLLLISDAHPSLPERKPSSMLSGSSRVLKATKNLELRTKLLKSLNFATSRSTETLTHLSSPLCPLEHSSMFQSCAQKRPRMLLRCYST